MSGRQCAECGCDITEETGWGFTTSLAEGSPYVWYCGEHARPLSATNRPHRRIANGHNQLHMSRWRQGPADRPPHVHDEGISG